MTVRAAAAAATSGYSIIIPEETVVRASDYLKELRIGRTQPGAYLRHRLQDADVRALTGYYNLYRRRLLPVFQYMNHRAANVVCRAR